MIFGCSKKCSPTETPKGAVNTTMLSSELKLNDNVKNFWEFDSKIAESANGSGYSQEDVKCIKKLHQETKWLQVKYDLILWSDKVEKLPNNFNKALERFRSLKKRIQKDPNLCENYKDKMWKYIKNGYARKLSNKEIDKTSHRTLHLPHHPVFSKHMPHKIRTVFDVTAEHEQGTPNRSRFAEQPDCYFATIQKW